MNCYIADLSVEIPAAGDLVPRCREYLCDENEEAGADIIICTGFPYLSVLKKLHSCPKKSQKNVDKSFLGEYDKWVS